MKLQSSYWLGQQWSQGLTEAEGYSSKVIHMAFIGGCLTTWQLTSPWESEPRKGKMRVPKMEATVFL